MAAVTARQPAVDHRDDSTFALYSNSSHHERTTEHAELKKHMQVLPLELLDLILVDICNVAS